MSIIGYVKMTETLTKELAYGWLQSFFSNDKPMVILGTGASCAVDPGAFPISGISKATEFV